MSGLVAHLWAGLLAAQTGESLPAPTLFVVVYAAVWLLLVGALAYLVSRQHRLERSLAELRTRLEARLQGASDDGPSSGEA